MFKVKIDFYEKAKELSPKVFHRPFHRCHMSKRPNDCRGFIKEAYDRQDLDIMEAYENNYTKNPFTLMSYEATGRIKQVLPLETGATNTGKEWQKQAFLIEIYDAKYPKEIAFTAWGKTTSYLENLGEGSDVTIHFEVSSREYNGKFYTDCAASKIQVLNRAKVEPKPVPITENGITDQLPPAPDENLPF
jgi:hypothetical protein